MFRARSWSAPDRFNDPVTQASPRAARVGRFGEEVDRLEWRWRTGQNNRTRRDGRGEEAERRNVEEGE